MLSAVFVDTCYFLALSTRRDRLHRQALALEGSLAHAATSYNRVGAYGGC